MSERNLRYYDLEEFKAYLRENKEVPEDAIIWKDVGDAVSDDFLKQADLTKREVPISFSTAQVDRDGDTINQGKIRLANFRKNPVVLFAHRNRELPIARSMRIFQNELRDKTFSVDRFVGLEMPEVGPLAEATFRMLSASPRFLNAASIGFRPIKAEFTEDKKRQEEFFMPTDFDEIEKLEHSIVPVPSNPGALVGAKSAGIDIAPLAMWAERLLDEGHANEGWLTEKHIAECRKIAAGEGTMISVPKLFEAIEGVMKSQKKGSTPSNPGNFNAAPEDTPWSKQRLTDFPGEGPFEERSAAERRRIAKAFAWAEVSPPKTFGQLKLGHHRGKDFAVIFRGVVAAQAVLLGARGGVNIPEADKRPAFNHLNTHRTRDFDRDPLEFRAYDEEELLAKLVAEIAEVEKMPVDKAKEALEQDIKDVKAASETPEPESVETVETETAPAEEAIEVVASAEETPKENTPEETKTEPVEGAEQKTEPETKEEKEFDFPSVKDEDGLNELRKEIRACTKAVATLVELFKEASKETEATEKGPKAGSKGAESTEEKDEVIMILADEEPQESSDAGDKLNQAIRNGMVKAVSAAFDEARGRLPN